MKRLTASGFALVLCMGALAACSDDSDDTAGDVQEANTEFCQDLATYGDAVKAFAALEPETATKDQYEDAADEVRSTREDMVESAESLSEAGWTNLEAQVDTLRDQLQDAPDDEAVAAILAEAKPQAVTVQASAEAVNTAVCTPANATTTT